MSHVVKSGFLQRYSRKFMQEGWKNVWCVLYGDSTMAWYKQQSDRTPKGQVNLKVIANFFAVGVHVMRIPSVPRVADSQTQLLLALPDKPSRDAFVEFFMANSVQELNEWMQKIVSTRICDHVDGKKRTRTLVGFRQLSPAVRNVLSSIEATQATARLNAVGSLPSPPQQAPPQQGPPQQAPPGPYPAAAAASPYPQTGGPPPVGFGAMPQPGGPPGPAYPPQGNPYPPQGVYAPPQTSPYPQQQAYPQQQPYPQQAYAPPQQHGYHPQQGYNQAYPQQQAGYGQQQGQPTHQIVYVNGKPKKKKIAGMNKNTAAGLVGGAAAGYMLGRMTGGGFGHGGFGYGGFGGGWGSWSSLSSFGSFGSCGSFGSF